MFTKKKKTYYLSPENMGNEINLRSRSNCPRYYARMTWEYLFRATNAHEWDHLDSFLIDLKLFEEQFTNETWFYWYYDKSGWTRVTNDFTEYDGLCYDKGYYIKLIPGSKILFEQIVTKD